MAVLYSIAGIGLILLGIAVRSIETLNRNYVFGFDQGADYLAARSIAVLHKLTLIGAEAGAGFAGLPGVFHGPGYRYILSLILFVFDGNPYGAIVLLFLISILVLLFYYRFGTNVFGYSGGLLLTVIAAISPPLSAQARMIWAPNFSAVLVIPFLYTLWLLPKKHRILLFGSAFLASTLYHFELPMAIPSMLAVVVFAWCIVRVRMIRDWLIIISGFIAGMLPMILFESRHGWNVIRGFFNYVSRANSSGRSVQLLTEIRGDVMAIATTIRESFTVPIPLVSELIPYVLIGGVIWYVAREKQARIRSFMSALLILFFSHLCIYIPYRGPVYSHYSSLLYFVYPLLMTYVLMAMFRTTWSRYVAVLICMLLLIGAIVRFPGMITTDVRDYGGTAKIRGKIDALDSIYRDAQGTPFGVLIFTPPIYPHAFEYLFLWYGARTYGYVPPFSREHVTYLLIEPDPEKPWSYNGWLETVIKTGAVQKRWTEPSGFIIEKRIFE